MSRSTHHRRATGLAVLLTLAGSGWTAAQAATPTTGAKLRAALPDPDDKADLPGTTEYVGHAGGTALAVVVHRSGAAVAFLCDGRRLWRRLAGRVRDGRLDLSGTRGSRLTGSLRDGRLTVRLTRSRNGRAAATGTVKFGVQEAVAGAGLRRLTTTLGGRRVEAEWVTTNTGIIQGVATRSTGTVATASSTGTDPVADAEVSGAGAGDGPEARRFLGKVRCGVVVLKFSLAAGRFENPDGSLNQQAAEDLDALEKQFDSLGCKGLGFRL
ncbi:MAG TPA: hypothetical protein VD931_06945 [Baekduia sp.]|nr:hypothetical protein [Baekduia sp.]